MRILSTPVDVTHATDATWTDIDITSHLVYPSDSGNVAGVYLVVQRLGATLALPWGLRKNGSAWTTTCARIYPYAIGLAVGVDSNNIFEASLGDASDFKISLLGYWLTDEAEFLDSPVAYASTTTGFEACDPREHFTGTAQAYLTWAHNGTDGTKVVSVQDVGGIDKGYYVQRSLWQGDMTPATAGQFEYNITDAAANMYVVAAITSGVTKFSPVIHEFTSASTWEDVDLSASAPAGSVAVATHFYDTGAGVAMVRGARPNGASWDLSGDASSPGTRILSPLSAALVSEHIIENTNYDSYTMMAFAGSAVPSSHPAGQLVTTKYNDIA